MRRPKFIIVLAALIYGGYWFSQHYKLDGLDKIAVRSRNGSSIGGVSGPSDSNLSTIPVRDADRIRIATFNIQVFGKTKLEKPEVMQVLAETVRRFDVVAIQEVRSTTDDIIPQFVDLINSTGRHYDFVIGPREGRTNSKEQYAFIFDAQTIRSIATRSIPSKIPTICSSARRWSPRSAFAARRPIKPSPSH